MAFETVRYSAPGWGVGELVLVDGRVAHHELPRPTPEPQVTNCYLPLVERLRRYFAGEREDFSDVELEPSDWTPLQEAIHEALRAVPYGEVVTYGELAALAGRPRAPRAAGAFCSQNSFPLFVPCHRVVSAGGIGAYGSLGIGYKRRLLELEGVAL